MAENVVDLRLLDEGEAAEVLGLKPRFLRELRGRGEITFRKVGRYVRYGREDLEEFRERCRQERAG